jgi:hypothetical protein
LATGLLDKIQAAVRFLKNFSLRVNFRTLKEVVMDVGMLWLDNDPQAVLAAKVRRAADYYRLKYGVVPDLCLVHPSMLNGHPDLVAEYSGKVAVRPNHAILPGYLWIGTEDKN